MSALQKSLPDLGEMCAQWGFLAAAAFYFRAKPLPNQLRAWTVFEANGSFIDRHGHPYRAPSRLQRDPSMLSESL